jgi:hypothetical protein
MIKTPNAMKANVRPIRQQSCEVVHLHVAQKIGVVPEDFAELF